MRYANKRQMFRKRGRFAKPPSLEQMGYPVAHGEMTCANCGHTWRPILITGMCPVCGSQDKVTGLGIEKLNGGGGLLQGN